MTGVTFTVGLEALGIGLLIATVMAGVVLAAVAGWARVREWRERRRRG